MPQGKGLLIMQAPVAVDIGIALPRRATVRVADLHHVIEPRAVQVQLFLTQRADVLAHAPDRVRQVWRWDALGDIERRKTVQAPALVDPQPEGFQGVDRPELPVIQGQRHVA